MSCNNSFTKSQSGWVHKASPQMSIWNGERTCSRGWTNLPRSSPPDKSSKHGRVGSWLPGYRHFVERGCIPLCRRGRTISRTSKGNSFSFPVVFSSVCSGAGNAQSLTGWSKDLHRERWRGLGSSTEAPRTVVYKVVSRSLRRAPLSWKILVEYAILVLMSNRQTGGHRNLRLASCICSR